VIVYAVRAALMREIKIKLWHNEEEEDWSIEVRGTLYQHVSTTTVDDLVEYELVAVQQALLKQVAPYHDSGAMRVHLQ
jgi:hypothetical protein